MNYYDAYYIEFKRKYIIQYLNFFKVFTLDVFILPASL